MLKIFDITAAGMNAQMIRLNTTASNMANATTTAGSAEEAYRARQPVFSSVLLNAEAGLASVEVDSIAQSQREIEKQYQPGNPLADVNGYVYGSNVNPVEEMANMISASRSYESNSEVFNTTKQLMLRTLQLGK